MRRKKALISVIGILLVTSTLLGWTFRAGNAPLLGLDLEGGLSVVLRPTGAYNSEQLEQAITIMDQRINALGVAEPDIHREGDNIVVQIAGLKDEDKDKAIKLVGQTAELRFRPVLAEVGPEASTTVETTPPGATTTTAPGTPPSTAAPTTGGTTVVQAGGGDPTTPPTGAAAGNQAGLVLGETASAAQAPSSSAPETAPTAVTTAAGAATPPGSTPAPADPSAPTTATTGAIPLPDNKCAGAAATPPSTTTTPEQDNLPTSMCNQVILGSDPRTEDTPTRYLLGPACIPTTDAPNSCLTGAALDTASASINPGDAKWTVNPMFKGGAEGIDKFNALAAKCFSKGADCPTQRMAITLDGLVLTAPVMKESTFAADKIQISGSFTQETAKDLATALQYGALPVTLEQQSSQTISASIGRDALTAGIVAGFAGVALVFVYMVAFYRILGLLAMVKLTVESAVLWVIISYLGTNAGLALTLAGVTGIIISVGVSLDSNIVYYENLREDVRSGRTIRSAVERSFTSSFSTILKADGASLLGAVLLYLLAIGAVRGFAFYLGLTTVLDLLGSYFFMRPLVYLTLNTKMARKRPGLFGLPSEQAVGEATRARFVRPSSRATAGAAVGGGGGSGGRGSSTDAGTDGDSEANR